MKSLLFLCEEIMEFVKLFDKEKLELVKETTEKLKVVQQFEGLYDSQREREIQFYEQMVNQQHKLKVVSNKIVNLKKKVSTHLKDLQKERDNYALKSLALDEKCQRMEKSCEEIKKRIQDQKTNVESLRKGSHSMLSEREMTDLNLKLRSLQNCNSQLLTDRTLLTLNLEELMSSLERTTGETPSYDKKNCDTFEVQTNTIYTNSLGESRGPTRGNFNALEQLVERLQTSIVNEQGEYEKKLKCLQDERTVYEKYESALKCMLENEKND
ncbi:uncharacterized protein LOC128882676 isoform X2 [Hylaeus volcanicus]|nr:uncharacterized protein LOC128882676 isoform X2 [Hylaeus volcanicus]XP_053990365.1 uncharacterized protein LOC128882676 isoform X2 [Hylaeus volcanicus]XP_053990366.1 uncharacterized protein LOC128882676 isoform X2 [Hylaeus volcanicus]